MEYVVKEVVSHLNDGINVIAMEGVGAIEEERCLEKFLIPTLLIMWIIVEIVTRDYDT